jgi:polar amino acid transport system substrate-binding protein
MSNRLVAGIGLKLLGLGFLGLSCFYPLRAIAADLETITQRGRLVVAVKDNLPPLGFRDADGQLRGFEIEIAQRLAQEILPQSKIDFQSLNNQDRLNAVTSGQVDLAIARITANSARSRVVSFSNAYYIDGTMLITRQPAIQKLADLKRQKIVVLHGSDAIAQLRYRLPDSELVGVDSYAAAQAQLTTGKAVAFAADGSLLSGWAKESAEYHLLPDRLSSLPLCIALPKGLQYETLRQRVNQAIARWQAEGWLQQRAIAWGLP